MILASRRKAETVKQNRRTTMDEFLLPINPRRVAGIEKRIIISCIIKAMELSASRKGPFFPP